MKNIPIAFEFDTETIFVEVTTDKDKEELEDELFSDAASYALNLTDWQPAELVEDVLTEAGYPFRILTAINISIPG